MPPATGLTLTTSLRDGETVRAIKVLQTYYAPPAKGAWPFTGAAFDDFDPSGDRGVSRNTFTADDLVAVTMLSVSVPPAAALILLDRNQPRFDALLEAIGPDRDLADVESVQPDRFPAHRLWHALRDLPGLGPTLVGKLMARKRPRLIPIFDSIIDRYLLSGSGVLWLRCTPHSGKTVADFNAGCSSCAPRPGCPSASRPSGSSTSSRGWTARATPTS